MKNLHGTLNLTPAQRQLLDAVGVPDNLTGAALITESAVRAIQQAATIWPDSAIEDWHQVARSLRKSVRQGTQAAPKDLARLYQAPISESAAFSLFTNWAKFDATSEGHSLILGLFGRAWVAHAQQKRLIPESFSLGGRALINEIAGRGKRSTDWNSLVGLNLLDAREAKNASLQLGPNAKPAEFLRVLLQVLETDVLPPMSEQSFRIEDQEQPDVLVMHQGAERLELVSLKSASAGHSDEGKSIHLDTRRISARLSAADYASALSKLGIEQRDHLLLDDLSRITRKLAQALHTEAPTERGYALFHLVCLLTATSDL